ncbi:MAG TPA: single-stranded-DNA-specific exonuclease RecJ, partial [Planctomycetaceae bacterium]|nr:single-stranded-DNA-specific exonuclease RecJ [Planctomycetaceae bacterium]
SRIAEQFEKPTILIAINSNTGIGQGSGRSFAGTNLHEAVSTCKDLLESFGGHAAAIGLRVKQNQIDQFRDQLCENAK